MFILNLVKSEDTSLMFHRELRGLVRKITTLIKFLKSHLSHLMKLF